MKWGMMRGGGASISAARLLLRRRSHSAPKMIAASPTMISAISPMLHASTLFSVPHVYQWSSARILLMPYESWVERQIREATERGEYEQSVREIVSDLNHRIAASHRIRVEGPPIVVRVVDVEHAVAAWRRRRRSAG